MTIKSRTGCMIIALLLCGAAPALAQTTPSTPKHVPLQKTIGQAKPEIVPSLIVMNARGASLQGGKLTLTGVAPNSIVFADRPVRAAAHSLTTDLLEEWAPNNASDDSFTKDPPNATVSVFSTDGSKIRDAVVVLKTAKLEGDRLTFDVDVLEGDLAGGDGPAALFIDRFGGGFHPAASTLVVSMRAAWAASTLRASAAVTRGSGVSAQPAPGVVPTSLAVPGIAEATVLQRSVPPRWVGLRWVRRQQMPPIPTAAIILTRPATETARAMHAPCAALMIENWLGYDPTEGSTMKPIGDFHPLIAASSLSSLAMLPLLSASLRSTSALAQALRSAPVLE